MAADATPDGQEAVKDWDAQRDHAEAERRLAVGTAGDLQNDVDTQNALATAEELWDSGDRRTRLAEYLTERVGTTDIGWEGVAAVLAVDLNNGTAPSAAVKAGKHPVRRQNTRTA